MKIRGYVIVFTNGTFQFSNFPTNGTEKEFTFELEVSHPLVELKVIPESVEEVKDGKEKA